MKWVAKLGAAVLAASVCASAADLAILKNGFTVRHERHSTSANSTRLYLDANGSSFVDVATDQIVGFEHDDTPAPTPERASPVPQKTIQEHISDASGKHGVDKDFISSVIHSESGFNPRAVSPKGAKGLMQLMPETASRLGVKDSFDPAANISGGTQYLRELLLQYHGDAAKALAAYNAGPHRVDQYHGVPPYRETQAYVARVIREYNSKKLAEQKASAASRQPGKAHAKVTAARSHGKRVDSQEAQPTVPLGGQ